MAYNGIAELAFAEGYYHIGFEGVGIVSFEEDTPEEVKEKFWKVWPTFHAKVVELEKVGVISSKYPFLPLEDPEENRKHYIKGDAK